MKKIPLTQGQEAIVDDHWYDYLMQWKWCALFDRRTQSFYAVRVEYKPFKKQIRMHRVVAKTPDGMLCDHIRHNTLDNRERELRNVTRSQSQMNRGTQSNNTVGDKGISIRKAKGRKDRYLALLKIQGKYVLNKTFVKLEDAVKARKEAEQKYFGEFAYAGGK